MLESVWMDVLAASDLHVDLNTTAWLLIGSLQLAVLCGVALALFSQSRGGREVDKLSVILIFFVP